MSCNENPWDQIFRAWHNIRIMLEDRGYCTVSMPQDLDPSIIKKSKGEGLKYDLVHKKTSESICVWFTEQSKVSIILLRTLVTKMENHSIERAILFCCCKKTSRMAKSLPTTYSKIIEIQWYENFFYRVIDHQLIPKFKILNEEEKNKRLEYLQTTDNKIPPQSGIDPISKYFGLSKGKMIEYYRANGYQEKSCYWRVLE